MAESRPDALLILKIRACVERRIQPHSIELSVGVDAILNTTRKKDALIFTTCRLDQDPVLHLAVPAFAQGTVVVLWMRPLSGPFPRLVGVIWGRNGFPAIFFAQLVD